MKKKHSALVKFKVALAALTGQPIIDICNQYEVAESLVHKWRKQLKEEGVVVFTQGNKNQKAFYEQEMNKLYQRIGQLSTENDFLKKVVDG
jgi:transposase-like protein